jgi:hypothetical protein
LAGRQSGDAFAMSEDKPKTEDELTEDEIGAAEGEALPDREAMSIITPPEFTLPVEPNT